MKAEAPAPAALAGYGLTLLQAEVMACLADGWGGRLNREGWIEFHGEPICRVETMEQLVALGLAERQSNYPYWMATEAGLKLWESSRTAGGTG